MRRNKPCRMNRVGWWALRTAPGFILAVIGLGGISDDLKQWQDWIISMLEWITPSTGRYLLIAGLVLAVAPNLPWRHWLSLLFGRKLNVEAEAESEEEPALGKANGSRAIREQILKAASEEYSKEWRGRTRGVLRGALGARYVREFNAMLSDVNPEGASTSYLRSLAARVDGSFSRSARLERQRESHRFNSAFDMIWEVIEEEPDLSVPLTAPVRRSVVAWRDKGIRVLQELLKDEHADAWKKVLAALALVGTEAKEDVQAAVKKAVLQLRAIYAKLDDTMLSTTFALTSEEDDSLRPAD